MIKNIFHSVTHSLLKHINSGHKRTAKAIKNIIISFLTKGISIIIGFIQLPIVLSYLGDTTYGIWLILGSIISWFGFFDIGLGNGMRNKFAEALANNDKKSAKIYVSTTYAILSIVMLSMVILFFIINPYLDWYKILNAPADLNENLIPVVYIVFISFALRFVLKLITTILVADQKPAIQGAIELLRRIINLIVLIILVKTTTKSLVNVALVFSITPILLLILASIYFYSKQYLEYVPSIKYINFSYTKDLINLGVRFFIIQIAVLVLYTTDNMIITQLFDPSQVTVYNIAHKYFTIITMGFTIILAPFWSSVTEAYHRNDFPWIKKTTKQLVMIWSGFFILTGIMLFCSNWVYEIWIGPDIKIPFSLSVAWAAFVVIQSFTSIFVSFINGVGKIKLQLYTAIFSMIFNIPLSILFAKYLNFGITGVIMGTIVSAILSLILRPLQYYKIINHKAKGIWNS